MSGPEERARVCGLGSAGAVLVKKANQPQVRPGHALKASAVAGTELFGFHFGRQPIEEALLQVDAVHLFCPMRVESL